MRFHIPDFALGALFMAIMATVAILFAFPELAGDWLWWALTFAACIAWAIGAGLFERRASAVAREPEAAERGDDGQQEDGQWIISPDTTALVNAINRQQRANRAQEKREDEERRTREIITMFIIAVTGGAIILQVSEMRKAYRPAQTQADVAEANERPWIKVDRVEPAINKFAPGGLFFVKSNFVGFLDLHLVIENIGRSPAFNIVADVWPQFGDDAPPTLKEQGDKCLSLGNMYRYVHTFAENSDFIPVLFPNDPTPYDGRPLAIMPEQINKAIKGTNTYTLWFYGCVYYEISKSLQPHQTGFAYKVNRLVDAPPPFGKAITNFNAWESVPADRILFTPIPLAAGPTD
jgi:hypothetical protein